MQELMKRPVFSTSRVFDRVLGSGPPAVSIQDGFDVREPIGRIRREAGSAQRHRQMVVRGDDDPEAGIPLSCGMALPDRLAL